MQHRTRDFGKADGGEAQTCRQRIRPVAQIATVMLRTCIKHCQ
jgi:hypothetical protein